MPPVEGFGQPPRRRLPAKKAQLFRCRPPTSNAVNAYPMPNRHDIFCHKRASQRVALHSFGFSKASRTVLHNLFGPGTRGCPNELFDNPNVGFGSERNKGGLKKSRCTVTTTATNSPGCASGVADQMQKNRRINAWRFFQYPALPARVQALRKSGHCWLADFRRSFLLTRPSSEVLPVPLGHSDQTAIKTAQPLGHASALLGRAQVIEAKSLKRFSFWQNYWSVPVRVPLQLFFQ